MRTFFRLGVFVALVAVAGVAAAQDSYVPTGESQLATVGGDENWGGTSDIIYTGFAHDFALFQGVGAPMNATTAGLICGTAPCGWLGGARLPAGAQIRSIEVSACDGDAVQQVQFTLFLAPQVPGAPTALLPFQTTGTTAVPGCTTFAANLTAVHTVNNDANVYIMDVISAPGTNIQWNQFRIFYRLQVSPAPAVASFPLDVPTTHPQFRFVEALAAAGITGGCGSGTFCPDTPVTRGQMAVFLSAALGLHFPN